MGSFFPTPEVVLKEYPHHLSKYEGNGNSKFGSNLGFSKIQIFPLSFYELQ